MTFCLGIKVRDGIVGLSDSRITSGRECTIARKVSVFQKEKKAMFVMTSGLRSLRDKVITYFNESLEEEEPSYDKLYKAVNAFGAQIRRVSKEDKSSLQEAGMNFDIHCLVGGQFENDDEHKLYLLYPEGNWVEIIAGTPYMIIGGGSYGKPVLDRTLKYEDTIQHALKVAILAFDSTRISASDVDYPIDLVFCQKNTHNIKEYRLEKKDLQEVTDWWQERMRKSMIEMPPRELSKILSELRFSS